MKGFFLKIGGVLSVFGPGPERILHTPVAVAGIRGTGMYVEQDAERAYICTCYGVAQLRSAIKSDQSRAIVTRHHESPFLFHPDGRVDAAPVIHHTDAELIMLEALLDRRPPFYDPLNPGGYTY